MGHDIGMTLACYWEVNDKLLASYWQLMDNLRATHGQVIGVIQAWFRREPGPASHAQMGTTPLANSFFNPGILATATFCV